MNEWTHFFIKIYLSHFILKREDVGCVWEMSWRRGQTVILTPNSSDHSSTSSSSWLGCLTVGHLRPKALCLLLALNSASCHQLAPTASGTWLYYCLPSTSFRCYSAYSHRCISWLTARSRVNMLHLFKFSNDIYEIFSSCWVRKKVTN